MDNQKLNTERLIRSLRKRKAITELSIYKSPDAFFTNYYAINGHFNMLYFHLTIYKHLDEKETIEISSNTDCKEEIEALLIKFNLV